MNSSTRSFFSMITMLVLLFALSACTAKGTLELSYDTGNAFSENDPVPARPNAAVSLERFNSEIQAEGLQTISQKNGDDGYDAALAVSEDQTSYIYMYLPDIETARSLLTDLDGDGQQDSDLSLVLQKDNYELYTQESASSGSADSGMYGKSLRADSMIIMISGPLENKDLISNHADEFLTRLGFDLT